MIEQKAEDNSTKQSELEILREQIDKLKGVIIHSSAPTQGDASRRRPKRSSRRETWCPGEAGAVGPGAAAGIGGTSSTKMSEGSSESDLTADIDKELGFGNFRIPDLPFGSGPDSSSAYPFVSRKRLYPSDSPLPISMDLSYSSEQPTPKQFRPLITPEKLPAFQRAEMLLSAKKEYTPTKDSGETVELRKEVARQKGVIVENQATVCTTSLTYLSTRSYLLPLSDRSLDFKVVWTVSLARSRPYNRPLSKHKRRTRPYAKSSRRCCR